MADQTVLVLDLGLSEMKAVLFALDGTTVAGAQRPVTTRSPRPGWFVQDPEEWWKAAVEACHHLWKAAGPRDLKGVAVTGHMHAPVLVDGAGRAVVECPIIWDRRAAADWSHLGGTFDARAFHERTGGHFGPQTVPAKLFWMSRHASDAMKRASALLAPKDFLRFRLTGQAFTDPTDAAGLLLFDIHCGKWAEDLAEAACVDYSLLPQIMPSVALAGTVTREAATALGISAGTPVITGAGDDVEALGLGAIHLGDVYEHLGSTGTLGVVTDRLVLDPEARVETVPHPYAGRWIIGGSTNVAYAGLDRIRLLLGDSKDNGVDTTTHPPSEPSIGQPYFLPYLSGERAPRWDESLRGAFVGLDLTTERVELVHAVLEGVTFSLRDIGEVLAELNLPMHRIYSSGGGTAIHAWAPLRASVYRLPVVTLSEGDATSRGTFLLATVGLGLFETLDQALEATAKEPKVNQPDLRAAASYEVRYRAFRMLVEALTPWFRAHHRPDDGQRS